MKKEETLALIPEENVLMDTEKAWISVRHLSAGFGTMLTEKVAMALRGRGDHVADGIGRHGPGTSRQSLRWTNQAGLVDEELEEGWLHREWSLWLIARGQRGLAFTCFWAGCRRLLARLVGLVSIVQSGLHDGCTMACTLHDLRRASCKPPLRGVARCTIGATWSA